MERVAGGIAAVEKWMVEPAVGWALFALFWALLLMLAWAEGRAAAGEAAHNGRVGANLILGGANWALLALVPLSGVAVALFARAHDFGLFNLVDLKPAAAFFATLLARSLAAYWVHRASHRVDWLWRIHQVHHCDVAVDVTTSFRAHPGEVLIMVAWVTALTAALGLSPAALFAYETVYALVNLWTHADVHTGRWVERRLGWLLATPSFHHVHHSAERRMTDSNYGELVTLWDSLFGTRSPVAGTSGQHLPLGLGPEFDGDAGALTRLLQLPFRRRRPDGPEARASTPADRLTASR